ncbi:TPA: hypothetical protein TT553_000194 [Streptococcus equi subsp. zooepidemicus]|nr:hypothetical protein [Streptococcus equi subsp. zooepidemicus]
MSHITITLEEDILVNLIFAAAQSSCGFDRNIIKENQMWHLDCCDYNQPIYEVLKQINLDDIQESYNKDYLKEVIEKGGEFFQ